MIDVIVFDLRETSGADEYRRNGDQVNKGFRNSNLRSAIWCPHTS